MDSVKVKSIDLSVTQLTRLFLKSILAWFLATLIITLPVVILGVVLWFVGIFLIVLAA